MLLVKAFHYLLLWRDTFPFGLAVVVRCKIGFRKLGILWPGSSGHLVMGVRQEVGTSYGMLTAVVETRYGEECSGIQRTA